MAETNRHLLLKVHALEKGQPDDISRSCKMPGKQEPIVRVSSVEADELSVPNLDARVMLIESEQKQQVKDV